MQADKKWDLISVASIPLIMTLSNSMLIPILPEISKQLNITTFQVSMLITVYSAVAILLIPIAGYLSDRFGRKKIMIPSLLLTAVGGGIAGLSAWFMQGMTIYWLILLGRFLQGMGTAGSAPIVLPLVGDLFRSENDVSKGLGIIETANTFGKVLSPVLGSLLAMVVWYLPFLLIPVFSLISVLLVAFLVKPPKGSSKPKESRKGTTAFVPFSEFLHSVVQIFIKKGRWLVAIFAIGGFIMFVIFGVLFYLSTTLEEKYHIDGVYKGLILAIPLASLCISSFLTGRWIGTNKKTMKWVTFSGLFIVTLSLLSICWFSSIYIIISVLIITGLGIGVSLPSLDAMITEGIEKKQRGTITSIYSSMRFIGVALGPPAVSLLMKSSRYSVFLTLASLSALGAVLALMVIRPKKSHAQKKSLFQKLG